MPLSRHRSKAEGGALLDDALNRGRRFRTRTWLIILGNALLPVSYQEMEDAVTGQLERRKVAKPDGV